MTDRRTPLLLLVLGLLLLTGCSTQAREASLLADLALDDLNGGQVDGAELAGKDVALWFWAPW